MTSEDIKHQLIIIIILMQTSAHSELTRLEITSSGRRQRVQVDGDCTVFSYQWLLCQVPVTTTAEVQSERGLRGNQGHVTTRGNAGPHVRHAPLLSAGINGRKITHIATQRGSPYSSPVSFFVDSAPENRQSPQTTRPLFLSGSVCVWVWVWVWVCGCARMYTFCCGELAAQN